MQQRSVQVLASCLPEPDSEVGGLLHGTSGMAREAAEASKKQAANREHQKRFRQRQKVH